MAGLEGLASIIYHEKQQEGSMLCAQHALNSLLQGNYFTAPDLSDIARNLDALEESYDNDNTGRASTNMDDTGFFSVQVLDNALKVWGLNLTRWRSENMRPYQEHPHTQLGFILNYQQHWFTLRRFGPAFPNVDLDPGDGHWFNLNSFLSAPEWVGKLYLGMVLQQAEADGYSVFAATQANPSAPLALPRTDADQIAATLPEPTGASHYRPSAQSIASSYINPTTSASGDHQRQIPGTRGAFHVEGLEDEDVDLQAALQASLMGGSASTNETTFPSVPPIVPPPLVQASVPLPSTGSNPASAPGSGAHTPTRRPLGYPPIAPPPLPPHPTGYADIDPVEASMERNRVMLQRMREQQEFAQRELWAEGGFGIDGARPGLGPGRREEDDEDEMLRRAIEESQALARIEGHGRPADEEDADGEMDTEADIPRIPAVQRNAYPTPGAGAGSRVYDDDDAELQAALRASLEHAPEGWQPPTLQPKPPQPPNLPPARREVPDISASGGSKGDEEGDADEVESVLSDATSNLPSSDTGDAAAEAVSVDELRRRRLARFGA